MLSFFCYQMYNYYGDFMIKHLKVDEIYESSVIGLENEGKGVCRVNNFIVFVPKALKDELVRFRIVEVKKNYAVGKLISVLKKSDKRVKSKCPYYDECGGCNLRHQEEKENLIFKKEKVQNALKRIGKIDIKVDDIVKCNKTDNYRNKASFKVEDNKIGFYREGTYQLIDINSCLLLDDEINNALKIIRRYLDYNINNIKNITIKKGNINNDLLIDIYSIDNKDKLIAQYLSSNIKNLSSVIFNDKIIYGDGYLKQMTCNLIFNCSSKSFYQVNNEQTEKLYNLAIKKAKLKKEDVALDLYCGTGTITNIIAKHVKKVIGIEIVRDAIFDANNNSKLNGIANTKFICGDASKEILKIKEDIDIIFLDPPRSGVDKKAIGIIKRINPKKIIYISCNPVTMARDLGYLNDLYDIKSVTPVDMFPNTSHVETICVLERR